MSLKPADQRIVDELADQLSSLLTDGAKPDSYTSVTELRAAGIPASYREEISQESRALTKPADAAQLATEFAERIVADLVADDGLSPAELAAKIERI